MFMYFNVRYQSSHIRLHELMRKYKVLLASQVSNELHVSGTLALCPNVVLATEGDTKLARH